MEKKRTGSGATLPANLGVACRSGLKEARPKFNQDSWGALHVPGKVSAVGVFDGHGDKGHFVSHFVKGALLNGVEKASTGAEDPSPGVSEWYDRVQRVLWADLKAAQSGTTATVVVHDIERERLVVSHVGDSTAVLLKRGAAGYLVAEELTQDHKPELAGERARITAGGGSVVFDGTCHRVTRRGVGSALNMSRSLGDVVHHDRCGMSSEPDVQVRQLQEDDVAVLVASDGVWEVITPKQAAVIIGMFPSSQPEAAAKKLADEAILRWQASRAEGYIDDITVVLTSLPPRQAAESCTESTVPSETPSNSSESELGFATPQGDCALVD